MTFGKIHNAYLENLVRVTLGKELAHRPLQEALDLVEEAIKITLRPMPEETTVYHTGPDGHCIECNGPCLRFVRCPKETASRLSDRVSGPKPIDALQAMSQETASKPDGFLGYGQHEGCNYLGLVGQVCNKCGKLVPVKKAT